MQHAKTADPKIIGKWSFPIPVPRNFEPVDAIFYEVYVFRNHLIMKDK